MLIPENKHTHSYAHKYHRPLQREENKEKNPLADWFLNERKKTITTHHCLFKFRLLLHVICRSFFISVFPRLSSFLIRVFVSFVSISKCPAHQGLWDTIHTVISPTTTTGWEGTRAPTAGSR